VNKPTDEREHADAGFAADRTDSGVNVISRLRVLRPRRNLALNVSAKSPNEHIYSPTRQNTDRETDMYSEE